MPTKLAADLLHLTEMVGHLGKPQAVLDALEAITWQPTRAHVLGASLLPLNFGTTDSLVVGKTVFLHKSAPKGWWEERMQLSPSRAALSRGCFRHRAIAEAGPPFTGRLSKGATLTPRELSVVRSLSLGHRVAQISKDLGLGEETVRSHIKKAQIKLGVRSSMHAVAQAVRLRLIP